MAIQKSELAAKQQFATEQKSQIASLSTDVSEKESRIADLNRKLNENHLLVTSLEQELAKRDDQVAGQSQALADREAEVHKHEVENTILRERLCEQDDELNRIYSSRSWRLTQPLRTIGRFLKN